MGENIPTHGNFFRFVLALRVLEWKKMKMVKSIARTAGFSGPVRKGKSKVSLYFHFYLPLKILFFLFTFQKRLKVPKSVPPMKH